MAYREHTPENPVRRRRTGSAETSVSRKRKYRRRHQRPDLLILAAVVVVLVAALVMQLISQNNPDLADHNDVSNQLFDNPTTRKPSSVDAPQGPLTFTEEDQDLIYVRSISSDGGSADSEELISALERELNWNLRDPSVTVLIIHSHVSESYTLNGNQVPMETSNFKSDPYRTDDERYNMVAIGARVAKILEENGIHVIHETRTFEIPNSDYAYAEARTYLEDTLENHPEICLILDLHRDAVQNSDGSQWAPTVTVNGKKAAKISMLIGFHETRDSAWNENLSFAAKLGAQLNRNVPETFRQLLIADHKRQYNQNMGPVSMLVEIGTAGNSLEEALNSADLLGQALVDMALGANVN